MASQLVELEDVDMSPRGSGYALDPRTSIHPIDEENIHRRRSVSPAPLPPQSYRNDDDYHNDRRRVSPKRDYAGEDGERDIRVDHHLREDIEMHERHRPHDKQHDILDHRIRDASRSPRRRRDDDVDDRQSRDDRRRDDDGRDRGRSPQDRRRESRKAEDDLEPPVPSSTLGVFGLSILTRERDLETLFRPFGRLESVVILTDKITGKSRGYGFIQYDNVESATKAIAAMNGTVYNERQMRVDYTKSTKRSDGKPHMVKRVERDRSPRGGSSSSSRYPPPAAHYPGFVPPPYPYAYYPYAPPYGYPPMTSGKPGKDGEITPPVFTPPAIHYDPRKPAPLPGAVGGPPALPPGFPAYYPPPFVYDRGVAPPRRDDRYRGGSSGRRERSRSPRDRDRDDRRRGGRSRSPPGGYRGGSGVGAGVRGEGSYRGAGDVYRRRDERDDRRRD